MIDPDPPASGALAHITRLLAHLAWADRRVLAAVQRDERVGADVDVLRTLAHVAAVEHLWLARMRGEPSPVPVWPALSVDECAVLLRAAHEELSHVAMRVTDDALRREVAYVNSAGEPWRNTVGDILVHTAMHGQYHRGQVVRAIRQAGGVPPATDYIVWVRTEGT